MMKLNLSLKGKLLTIGTLLTLVPLMVVCLTAMNRTKQMLNMASAFSEQQAKENLSDIVDGIKTLCDTRHQTVQSHVVSGLGIAASLLKDSGEISFSDTVSRWKAVNQLTQESTVVELKTMSIGAVRVGSDDTSPGRFALVDQVKKVIGGTCTLFQRMNDQGDMLRISTNVLKKDGTRAIGTYIPAVEPDGAPNAVISAVLKGGRYIGRAFVVNDWYITAYEPLYDADRRVIGMLYVGILQDEGGLLRKQIMKKIIGDTGYVYVLNSKGEYIVSKNGERDGEIVYEARDSSGSYFIREICEKALSLKEGELAEHRYPWKNPGEPEERLKIAKIAYFQPWDWVIGAGAYESEIFEVRKQTEAMGEKNIRNMVVIIAVSMVCASLIWIVTATQISRKITLAILQLNQTSDEVHDASGQLDNASHQIAKGISEQSASVEETAEAMEKMSAMTKNNAQYAQQAAQLTRQANRIGNQANQNMTSLIASMKEAAQSSETTKKIVSTINEIAFQTNLLALNAAVEAARAGESGAGFSVVAEEVRNLAVRASEAAKDTSALIDGTVKKIGEGSTLVSRTNADFSEILAQTGRLSALMEEIDAASRDQARGIEHVNVSIAEMSRVIQEIAASAEESASASGQLNGQSTEMKQLVRAMTQIVGINGMNG